MLHGAKPRKGVKAEQQTSIVYIYVCIYVHILVDQSTNQPVEFYHQSPLPAETPYRHLNAGKIGGNAELYKNYYSRKILANRIFAECQFYMYCKIVFICVKVFCANGYIAKKHWCRLDVATRRENLPF